jgi:uncharacterized protein YdeI (BOF family)
MKLKFLFGLTLAATASTVSVVQAQTAIQDLQRNDTSITIAGVVRSVVGNEFILDDGTGQLIVDAGPRWYQEINLSQGEQVTVAGEYDDYDFDAYRITRENGEVITIRDGSGPPPWAGGRRN